MPTWTNIGLMIYFTFVSLFGTLGNGILLLAYGNRWNSSRSTSVVFILILACFDLWTCLIVAPTFAIMEYREFEVPTLLCRFYSFSKNLIISSSLIMSFIAFDRFLNIALPHYRLLNPRRVKFLLTLFILIGVGLGILIALAFSSAPYRESYLARYHFILSTNSQRLINASCEISLTFEQKNSSEEEFATIVHSLLPIPDGTNLTDVNLTYLSTHERCFADTSIISETIRDILRHISNKCFFVSIGIVTILYTITFLLALHRQNPRIRALKRSLNVLNKFDAYPSNNQHRQQVMKQRNDSIGSYRQLESSKKRRSSKNFANPDHQQYEMVNFVGNDDLDEQNTLNTPKQDYHNSNSDAISEDFQTLPNLKQVSFQVDDHVDQQHVPFLSPDSDRNNDTYYRFPCPCSTTRQLLIKFHFAQPTLDISQWLCFCCLKKAPVSIEDEPSAVLTAPASPSYNQNASNSEVLRKQLHRQRLKQIRMASTFLLITVSFVLFYLPSTLTAERILRSPILIYYLFLCTHALNPLIYCFMNVNLRAYVISMLKCQSKSKRNLAMRTTSMFER